MARKRPFNVSSDLQQGIADSINSTKDRRAHSHLEHIPVQRIDIDPTNPRELSLSPADFLFEETQEGAQIRLNLDTSDPNYESKAAEREDFTELVESIRDEGVQQSITVYRNGGRFTLIAGERRLIGSMLANEIHIPAHIHANKPSNIKTLQYIENIHRQNLSAWERLENIKGILDEEGIDPSKKKKGTNESGAVAQLAKAAKISNANASTYLAVLDAPDDVLAALKSGQLSSIKRAATLSKITDTQHRAELLNQTEASLAVLQQQARASQTREQTAASAGRRVGKVNKRTPGRKSRYVKLGRTSNLATVKTVIEKLTDRRFMRSTLKDIDWEDPDSVTEAFRLAWSHVEDNQHEQ